MWLLVLLKKTLKLVPKVKNISFILLGLTMFFTSCHNREIAYLSDAQRDTAETVLSKYVASIMPGDQLYIYVSSLSPEGVIPFNQETHKIAIEVNDLKTVDVLEAGTDVYKNIREERKTVESDVSGYFVNAEGSIVFPVLGKIEVEGFTVDSLCRYLEKRLRDEGYVLDPHVEVSIMNFRVTVVGEVRQPQQIHVEGTRLTILEALAICGDLTEYGRRDNLVVMRHEQGQQIFGEIDLTKKEMLDSPYYYLHNNDIVYIEPTEKKKRRSDRDPNVPAYISTTVSAASLVAMTMRNMQAIERSKKR